MSDMVAKRPVSGTGLPQSTKKIQSAKEQASEKPKHVARPVRSSEDYEAHNDRPDYRESSRDVSEGSPRKMGCAFWITVPACLVALVLVLGGLLSGARIVITPQSWSGTVDSSTTFSLSGGTSSGSESTPVFYTATKKFTEEATVPATAATSVATYAEGTVRFYNRSTKSVTIPAQSEITLTELVKDKNTIPTLRYVTTKAVTLPKGSADKPTQKDVTVVAIKPGTMFNTQPTDFTLLKPVDGVTIRGVTALAGGADSSDRTIDPDLLTRTEAELKARFDTSEALLQRVAEDVPNSMIALPISFITKEPKISIRGSGDSEAIISAEKTVTALLVRKSELARVIGNQVGVPKDRAVTIEQLDGLTVVTTALGSADNIPNRLPVRITGTATISGYVDPDSIVKKIVGKSKRDTKALLQEIPEIAQLDIHMIPFWRRILPLDSNKISVTVLNP